ncbi:MAG: cation/acetate symporter, partial [Kribbellaceae bacterium]|nr:cation/acetate symporter [Kribbellaceae bacterium]
ARGRKLEPAAELKEIRRNVVVIGITSVVVGTAMVTQLTHIFIPTSIDLAGACVLPAVIYSLFWRRFNTRGALWSIYGGLASAIILIAFSPVVSGKVDAKTHASLSMITDTGIDFHWFPLDNPGIVSIPLAFFLGWLGTVTSKEGTNVEKFAEMEVRSLTGAGAEKATQH